MSENIKIELALIDPKWNWGRMEMENMPFLMLHHPEHGPIACILAEETLDQLLQGLASVKTSA